MFQNKIHLRTITYYLEKPMSDKIIAIISSNDEGKCRTGLAYAMNALKNEWMADVKIYIFGPAEVLVTKHEELQALLREFQLMDGQVVACKAIADRYEVSDKISELGVEVEYIGKMVSDSIKEGYTPMVW